MSNAWYQVLSKLFGYLAAAAAVAVVLLALRSYVGERRRYRRVRKGLPGSGAAGVLRVLSAGSRRLPPGEELPVPYEGTLGSAHSCDVCIPHRRVHMRSAFFWMERDGLHMVALHRDGFCVDDVPVEPGDEAILGDGAVLTVGELRLVLRLRGALSAMEPSVGPYVTTARRSRAQQGRGDGLGAPGRGEMRREKKLEQKQRKQARRQQDEEEDEKPRTRKGR